MSDKSFREIKSGEREVMSKKGKHPVIGLPLISLMGGKRDQGLTEKSSGGLISRGRAWVLGIVREGSCLPTKLRDRWLQIQANQRV